MKEEGDSQRAIVIFDWHLAGLIQILESEQPCLSFDSECKAHIEYVRTVFRRWPLGEPPGRNTDHVMNPEIFLFITRALAKDEKSPFFRGNPTLIKKRMEQMLRLTQIGHKHVQHRENLLFLKRIRKVLGQHMRKDW